MAIRNAVALALGAWCLACIGGCAMTGESREKAVGGPHAAPRLAGIVLDGRAEDWADGGLEIGMLVGPDGSMRPPADLDATVRLGWDERGLLVLVHVHDDVWRESPPGFPFYQGDSIQVFLATADAGRCELSISPGMDPNFPEARTEAGDHRTGDNLPAFRFDAALRRYGGGYTMEVLVPWANFSPAPKPGGEIGVMVIVNDSDEGRDRYAPRWRSHPEWDKGLGLRLAEQASAPVNLVVGSGRYERFRRTEVRIDAVGRFAGRRVALRETGRTLADGVLACDATRASAVFSLPMPPRGSPYGPMEIRVEGEDPVALLLPDADEQRALALMAAAFGPTAFVFSGSELPRCDFDQPSLAEDLIGPYTVETTYYDADFNIVTSAERPGRYGAVSEITPQDGRPFRRYRTLYRAPGALPRGMRPDAELLRTLGLAPEAAPVASDALARAFARATADGIARQPELAVLLAGLVERGPDAGPMTVYDDPSARDRQWWVTAKRLYLGLDRHFAQPVALPERIAGAPAPVLREGTPEEAGVKPEAVAKIDEVCTAWAADSDEPFAVCLARNGVAFLHKAYGGRAGQPATAQDRFGIASATKPFGGVLMMRLVEQGLVDLDDPIEKYLPAWRGAGVKTPITIRALYTHAAGFGGEGFIRDEANDAEEVAAASYPWLKVHQRFEYATTSYTLAGKIIEVVSGLSVPAFYRQQVLDPLGMRDTEARHMGYGIRCTARDLAVFGQMLANRGAYGDVRILRQDTFEKMLPRPLVEAFGPGTTEQWGIGVRWYRIEGLGERIIGHNAASNTIFRVDLDKQLVIVMARNRAGRNYEKYEPRFFRAIADALAE